MSIATLYKVFLDEKAKMRVTKHAKKQQTIGMSLKSITLGGTQFLNWADTKMEHTLHRQLMCVESIYNKKVVRLDTSNKKDKSDTFKGRLFYTIIPNQKRK